MGELPADAGAAGAGVHRQDVELAERPGTEGLTDGSVWAKVRWTESDGDTRTGLAKAQPGRRAGSSVTVWTGGKGEMVAGARVYDTGAYRIALSAVIIGCVIGFFCSLAMRETYCRPLEQS